MGPRLREDEVEGGAPFTKEITAISRHCRDIETVNGEYQNMELALYVSKVHNVFHNQTHQGPIQMNITKNMEAVFVAALIIAGFTTFATAEVTTTAPAAKATAEAKMATVVVSTKRLTAAEKARLGS
jgi:hypothetical protein